MRDGPGGSFGNPGIDPVDRARGTEVQPFHACAKSVPEHGGEGGEHIQAPIPEGPVGMLQFDPRIHELRIRERRELAGEQSSRVRLKAGVFGSRSRLCTSASGAKHGPDRKAHRFSRAGCDHREHGADTERRHERVAGIGFVRRAEQASAEGSGQGVLFDQERDALQRTIRFRMERVLGCPSQTLGSATYTAAGEGVTAPAASAKAKQAQKHRLTPVFM